MMEIIDRVISTRDDPGQLQVTQKDIARLQNLHPSTLSEYNEGKGPCAWVLLIPTSEKLMHQFLEGELGETELLWNTIPGSQFETIYLCSVTTLPEYRNKGITSRLTLEAIDIIRKDHPIKSLFVWPFSEEGKKLAEKIANKAGLPLHIRAH